MKPIRNLRSILLKAASREGQAKIKVVLEDKRITAACVGRGDIDAS